jgi:hypothetical protein
MTLHLEGNPFPYRDRAQVATRNLPGRGKRMYYVIAAQTIAMCGTWCAAGTILFHQGAYLYAQITSSSSMVPDALGPTVLTVGGGGLVVAVAAVSKDFWSYKKQLMESEERREKEDRESRERIETLRIQNERLRFSQSKNNKLTNAMLEWMVRAHETKSFPPPPPRIHLVDEPKLNPSPPTIHPVDEPRANP